MGAQAWRCAALQGCAAAGLACEDDASLEAAREALALPGARHLCAALHALGYAHKAVWAAEPTDATGPQGAAFFARTSADAGGVVLMRWRGEGGGAPSVAAQVGLEGGGDDGAVGDAEPQGALHRLLNVTDADRFEPALLLRFTADTGAGRGGAGGLVALRLWVPTGPQAQHPGEAAGSMRDDHSLSLWGLRWEPRASLLKHGTEDADGLGGAAAEPSVFSRPRLSICKPGAAPPASHAQAQQAGGSGGGGFLNSIMHSASLIFNGTSVVPASWASLHLAPAVRVAREPKSTRFWSSREQALSSRPPAPSTDLRGGLGRIAWKLCGTYRARYGGHGVELVSVITAEGRLPRGSASTVVDLESEEGAAGHHRQEAALSEWLMNAPRIECRKLVGDPNVPAQRLTFIVPLDASATQQLAAAEETFGSEPPRPCISFDSFPPRVVDLEERRPTFRRMGLGQINEMPGHWAPKFVPAQLVVYPQLVEQRAGTEPAFSVLWAGLLGGHYRQITDFYAVPDRAADAALQDYAAVDMVE